MDIMGVLGSVVSGGVTGVVGSALQGVLDYKNKKLQFDHELEMEKAARETMAAEWAQRTKVAEVEGATQQAVATAQADAQKEVAAMEAFSDSIKADRATYSKGIKFEKIKMGWLYALLMVIVDFLRGIIRPLSTILFIAMTFMMYFSLKGRIDYNQDNPQALMELFNQVVTVILYLATTTTTWWYGVRGTYKGTK